MTDRNQELRERLRKFGELQIANAKEMIEMMRQLADDFSDMDSAAFDAILIDETRKTERAIEELT